MLITLTKGGLTGVIGYNYLEFNYWGNIIIFCYIRLID